MFYNTNKVAQVTLMSLNAPRDGELIQFSTRFPNSAKCIVVYSANWGKNAKCKLVSENNLEFLCMSYQPLAPEYRTSI